MNFRHILFISWAILSCLTACKHQEQAVTPGPPDTQPNNPAQNATPIGQPQGAPTTQTIGPEGGTITTPDGTVKLVLPAGAVTKATTITIQPITNEVPNGLGMAYRFSPDGTQFAKPATLTVHYNTADVAANDPDLLQVGYQGSDQRWVRAADVQVDTTNQQISVPMPHFSDWSAYELAKLELLDVNGNPADGKKAKLGESIKLEISEAILIEPLVNPDRESLTIKDVAWSVLDGGANGQVTGKGYQAVYTAPNKYPPHNPIIVVAEITFKERSRKAYLLKRIYIETDDYFRGTIDGVAFDWPVMSYTGIYDKVLIVGGEAGWVPNIQISIYHGPDNLTGSYPYTEVVKENRALIGYRNTSAVGDGSINYYYECTGDLVLSSGGVTITNVERKDGREIVEGSFTATVYKVSGKCPAMLQKKTALTGSFHLSRTVTQ
ncbi:hypothetical protein GO755_16310 [Spirosoma sp. HMF4905]|uniref:ZU5 domain-containing protein n=1 Tax=Spirosoma arboris TaxID=2682092 RepID=A0A7K1SCS8_9BACT|nr:hypothetical protein [Spirosoma arboris]MVM31612.1 hypothetical protein [Spirosoma arboris]